MSKKLLVAIAINILFTSLAALPSLSQTRGDECTSQITKTPGFNNFAGECIPVRLRINPGYGNEYIRLMRIAIESVTKREDYDTAIINFYRAQQYSGNSDLEVRRGLLGAEMAKAIKKHSTSGYSPLRMWLLITGEYRNPNF